MSGSGEFSIGQAVATTDNVTFNNLILDGNLTVSGTTTTVNTETINLADNIITLNSNATGSASQNAGIEINRGSDSDKSFIWNETDDKWTIGSETFVAGTVEAALTGNVTGNVTGTVSSISNHDTDSLTEGSSNLYHTTARARAVVSGGTGLTYNSSTGVFDIDSTVVTESSTDTLTNKTINFENNTVIVEFAVTVANVSGNKYHFDGETSASVQLAPGFTYRFDLSDSSVGGHPFLFSTTQDGTHNSGSSYTTGVTSNGTAGQSGAYIEITVDAATPDTLYYYCQHHSGMGGNGVISVAGSSLSASTTDDLSEGSTNLYYTDARVDARLSGGTNISYSSGTINFDNSSDLDMGGRRVLFANMYSQESDLPSASTYHGMFAHVHGTGKGYFGHAGNWVKLLDETSSDTDDLTEGSSNLYYTDARFDTRLGTKTTDNLTEGSTNVYYTDTRFDTRLSAKTTDNLTEGSTNLYYTDTRVGSYLTTNSYATQSYVNTQVSNLVDSAPSTLDTLNELAAALGDDANFSTTITNSIATKLATADFNSTLDARLSGGTGITYNAGAISVDSTAITDQSAYSGTVDITNDFMLIYDHSTTSLKKIAVSDLNSASGAGTMTSFDIAGDSGSSQTVADSNVLTIAGGTGIDTSVGGTDTVTVALNTEAVQDIVGGQIVTNGSHTGISFAYDDANDGAIDATVSLSGFSTSDLSEGTNLYYTNARFDTRLGTKTTDNLTEGSTNLYFTNARADARIAAATLNDLNDVIFNNPSSSDDSKVISYSNSSGGFVLSSLAGLSGSGEVNTASNVGTAGVGVFKQKTGEDLEFKKINAGSAKITITDDTSNNEVDIDFGTVAAGDLSDVTTSGVTNGQALVYSSSNSRFEPGDVTATLSGLTDTTISSLSTNQLLRYSGSAWVNVTLDTDGVGEGSSNLYYTDARADARIAAATTDDLSEGSSNLYYTNARVQSYLSGGTGVTLSGSGEFSIGQDVATSANVTFADVAATGNLTVTGNLDVNGTTTTIDTTNSTIADRLIELGTGTTGTPANDMGIVLERGSSDNAFIGWDESADKFIVGTGSFTGASTGDLTITTGTLVADLEGNVTGNATGVTTAAITSLTEDTSPAETDLIMVYDGSAGALKKVAKSNFAAAVSFDINDEMPLSLADSSSDPIQFTNVGTSGTSLVVTLADGSVDNIDIVSASNSATMFRDNDVDTFIKVEDTTDDDTIKMNTAGSQRLTIDPNGVIDLESAKLEIAGAAGSANEVLTTNGSGVISWAAPSVSSVPLVEDADSDTKIQVDEGSADDDTIRFDIAGTEKVTLNSSTLDVNATLDLNGNNIKGYSETKQSVTSSSNTIAIDMSLGNTGAVTLSENITGINFTNVPTSGTSTFTLVVTQDGTGSRTMAINAITINGGGNVTGKTVDAGGLTLTTTASKEDIVTFLFVDAGTPFINALLNFG